MYLTIHEVNGHPVVCIPTGVPLQLLSRYILTKTEKKGEFVFNENILQLENSVIQLLMK